SSWTGMRYPIMLPSWNPLPRPPFHRFLHAGAAIAPNGLAPGRLAFAFDELSLVELQDALGTLGRAGIVRHHENGLVHALAQLPHQVEDFLGGAGIQIAGWL